MSSETMAKRALTEILRAALGTISDKSKWCQGASARNSDGVAIRVDDPSARQWCATGAVLLAARRYVGMLSETRENYGHPGREQLSKECGILSCQAGAFLTNAARHYGFLGAIYLNDATCYDTVVEAFGKAIRESLE